MAELREILNNMYGGSTDFLTIPDDEVTLFVANMTLGTVADYPEYAPALLKHLGI